MQKDQLISQLAMALSDFETWHPADSKYFGPTSRALSIYGEVNKDIFQSFTSQLMQLAEQAPEEPVTVWLNTEGGSLTDGLAIYDTIKNVSCPVIIIATGLCASAGLIILSAGDYRTATQSCVFFYHEPIMFDSSVNSSRDMQQLHEHYDFCKTIADDIIKQRSKIKKSTWNKNFEGKTSYYFNSDDALNYNLIDEILESEKVEFKIEKE